MNNNISEKDMFMWMLNKAETKVKEKLNGKDEGIPEAATENYDTSEKKAQA